MHENRETSEAPRPEREGGRSAKAQSHTADAHAPEESDRAILSMNQPNKEEGSSAEAGEKRARAKENICLIPHRPDTVRGTRVPGIQQCGRVTTFLAPSPRWEPYALTRSYGSVRGAISDGRPYRDLTGENVSTRWLEAIKYPRQQTSLAVSMGRTLE